MIFEVLIAGIIGLIFGFAAGEGVLSIIGRLRPNRLRSQTMTPESGNERLLKAGAFLMQTMPESWSRWLSAKILQRLPLFRLEVRAKSRQWEFARLLPDFADILAIGVEAGLSFDRAIHLYCDKFTNLIAEVFQEVLVEIEVGKPRAEAFRGLIARTKSPDIEWFITAVIQSEKLGSPLAKTLKTHAKNSRERQKELVRELSATASIKMLFPIAGMILPSLMIVVIGPAFLRFMQQ